MGSREGEPYPACTIDLFNINLSEWKVSAQISPRFPILMHCLNWYTSNTADFVQFRRGLKLKLKLKETRHKKHWKDIKTTQLAE